MASRTIRFLFVAILAFQSAAGLPETVSYTIQEGDTLFSIAKKLGIPVDVICAFNGIADSGRVKAGMQIRLPRSYTVVAGDTLYGISKSFSVPLSDLLAVNKLRESSSIKAGEKLFIPVGAIAANGLDSVYSTLRASSTPVPEKANSFVLPHPGKREPFQGKIPGLVFQGSQGDAVVSASSGEVEWVAPYWGWGKVVIIQGDDGLKFIYAGNEELLVNVGDRVKAGSEIAHLGVSPQGGGARLYFSIQAKTGQSVNPDKYFSKS
jgi:murein DD-endopeptidase MepM/ murein hydrolase activator NlpD